MLNYPFPYDSARTQQAFTDMTHALLDALAQTDKPALDAKSAAFRRAMTAFRQSAPAEAAKYFDFQLWQEGVARYTEITLGELAAKAYTPSAEFSALPDFKSYAAVAGDLRRGVLSDLGTMSLAQLKRVVVYSTGAADALLLDKVSPAWKGDFLAHRFRLADAPAPSAPPHPCPSAPINHQLDFWIGRWDVAPWSAPAGTPQAAAGTNAIEPNLQQCVLVENWRAANGSEGKSFNFYDINQKKWRQVWVADGGGSLDYSGEFRDGTMRFEGWTLAANGAHTRQRLTFTPYGRDTVRQTFSSSTDGGKTWVTGFDGRYVRQSAPPAGKDETYRSPSGSTLRLMLSDANLGSEVSMGELTIPPNSDSGEHMHGAIEILYVLAGELEHTVNGKTEILTPGMSGFVKPPDKIRHKTGAAGAKLLVVWVPGDEARRIVARWQKEP